MNDLAELIHHSSGTMFVCFYDTETGLFLYSNFSNGLRIEWGDIDLFDVKSNLYVACVEPDITIKNIKQYVSYWHLDALMERKEYAVIVPMDSDMNMRFDLV